MNLEKRAIREFVRGFAVAGSLLVLGCLFESNGESNRESNRESNGDPSPTVAKLSDSIVVDLFSLNAAVRMRDSSGRLTTLGKSRYREFDSSVVIGDEVLFRTDKKVKTWEAEFLHEADMACRLEYQGDDGLIFLYDDSMEGQCYAVHLESVPAYPYRMPATLEYTEGEGFRITAWAVDFAVGKLIIRIH